jgi:hypothetical protein
LDLNLTPRSAVESRISYDVARVPLPLSLRILHRIAGQGGVCRGGWRSERRGGVRQGRVRQGGWRSSRQGHVCQGGWRSSRRVAFGKDLVVKAGGNRKGGWQSSRSQSSRRGDIGSSGPRGSRQGRAAVVKATPMSSRRGGSRQGNVSKEAFVKVGRL